MSVELAVPIINRGAYLIPGYLVQGHCEKLLNAAISQEFQFQFQQISDGQIMFSNDLPLPLYIHYYPHEISGGKYKFIVYDPLWLVVWTTRWMKMDHLHAQICRKYTVVMKTHHYTWLQWNPLLKIGVQDFQRQI